MRRYLRNNVILADEMGLGKTIQTIGYLRCIAVENRVRDTAVAWLQNDRSTLGRGQGKFLPFLIVCPLAVVDNWEREFRTWCPELDVVVYKGSAVRRSLS
jgi:SNF2 family DNA or RNA helicase